MLPRWTSYAAARGKHKKAQDEGIADSARRSPRVLARGCRRWIVGRGREATEALDRRGAVELRTSLSYAKVQHRMLD